MSASRLAILLSAVCLVVSSFAEEPDFSSELPRIPAVAPDQALATFAVKDGYRMELVAAEPLVASPVAVCWDEAGRMYVVEMRGYSEHRDEKLSRVRLLHDDNKDGVYDRDIIFADNLLWPTAITCWNGGVFVADAPDILYLKDADGDGQAEIRTRIFTGFGTQNVQGLLNSFHWGLDNRIHGSASSNGGQITQPETKDKKPVVVNGRDFSFDPRTLDFRAESGGAQHGMSFDDFGHKFVCSNSDHCQQVMFEDRYAARNPLLAAPSARLSIAVDGPQAEVFRASPVEPWRIVRTRLRVAGAAPGPIEGGGRAAGYFTGSTGVTVVRGSAFVGDEMYGMVVVGDVGSNLIHRKRLTLDGVQYKAERVDKESEFIASKDNWFRPAQFANGPDGALYAIDVYREVIEHPASLPPVIKKHLDLDSGRDRGRIWRIAPQAWQRPKVESLDKKSTAELVALLDHKNAWQRETTARLIYQRQDKGAEKLLIAIAKSEQASPAGRMHALYALAGLKKLNGPVLAGGLNSTSPRLREHAVRLAGDHFPQLAAADRKFVLDAMQALADDDDPQVRLQFAFALGQSPGADRIAGVAQLLSRDAGDKWIRFACLTSLPDPYALLEQALRADQQEFQELAPVLPELALLAGRTKNSASLAKVCAQLSELPSESALLRIRVLRSLLTGAGLTREEILKAAGQPQECVSRQLLALAQADALRLLADDNSTDAIRSSAVEGLSLGALAEVEKTFADLLGPRESPTLQIATLQSLNTFVEPRAGELILSAWPGFAPEVRRTAIDVLVSRPERAKQLLTAIAERELSRGEIDAAHIDLLKKHGDPAVRDQAAKVFASSALARRADVVEQYRPVLEQRGDVQRGKLAFTKNCAGCHKVEGTGHELGPNLAAMKNRGPETILLNVLDPNREVNPQFLSYVVATTEGKTLSGVIAAESATSITLKRADGQGDEILRSEIEELRSTGLSLMPEGLEKQLDPAAMADVIAYLMSLR